MENAKKLLYVKDCIERLVLPATRENMEYAMRAHAMIDAMLAEVQEAAKEENKA